MINNSPPMMPYNITVIDVINIDSELVWLLTLSSLARVVCSSAWHNVPSAHIGGITASVKWNRWTEHFSTGNWSRARYPVGDGSSGQIPLATI